MSASGTNTSRATARTVCLAKVTPVSVAWLWEHRIPRGMITLVDGDPGLGKSTMLLDLAAQVTRGSPMPGDDVASAPGDVIVMTAEDSLEAIVQPRLAVAGADLTRVHALDAIPRPGDSDRSPTLSRDDLVSIEATIVHHQAVLVIIDPLVAYLPPGIDAYRDQDVRRVLGPLAAVAGRTNAAIVVVRHLRKSGGSALYRGSGSIGIAGAARSVLHVGKDPDDPAVRVIAPVKSNVGPLPAAMRWRLVDHGGVGCVEWLGTAEGVSADDLAALHQTAGGDDASSVDDAIAALQEALSSGARPAREVEADVVEATGASRRTIERARAQLGVVAKQVRGAGGRVERVDLTLPAVSTPPEGATPPPSELGGVVGAIPAAARFRSMPPRPGRQRRAADTAGG